MNLAVDTWGIIMDGGRKNSALWGFETLCVGKKKKHFHPSGKKLNGIVNVH